VVCGRADEGAAERPERVPGELERLNVEDEARPVLTGIGMPMIVMHRSIPAITYSIASQIPARTSQIRLRSTRTGRSLPYVGREGQRGTKIRRASYSRAVTCIRAGVAGGFVGLDRDKDGIACEKA
jgi:hypothetical protein